MVEIQMRITLFFILLFFVPVFIFTGEAAYKIKNLNQMDPIFIKFKEDIKNNHATWQKIKKRFEITSVQQLKKLSIAIYKVRKNDTVFNIAERLGLAADTVISFNSLASDLSLDIGDDILIPNMDGVVLFPDKKVYIKELEKLYSIYPSVLMYINNVDREFIYPKEEFFIPFARMTEEEKGYFYSKTFLLPLKGAKFTSSYGSRRDPFNHRWTFHGGVDLGVCQGTPVYASSAGAVFYTGKAGNYGKLVVIKHKYGYTSWYGHLSKILVSKGQNVRQGDLLALSGNTGRSTGPHLHFEIRRFNLRKNPMEVLDFKHSSKTY